MTEDELDERLARAARSGPRALPETLDAMARDARNEGRRTHRRRVVGGVAGGLLALVAGAIAAPAAADGIRDFLAITDEVCQGGTECQEGDPFIDLSASDLPELVHADYPSYLELPPGMSRADIEQRVVERLAQPDAVGFEIAIGQQYENIAYCGWVNEWLDADSDGDDARADAAAGVMRRSVDWPAMASSVVDDVWFTLQTDFADAADDGDRTGVRAASMINICGEEEDAEIRAWMAAWQDAQ